jgi:hypothetical protein
MHGIHGIKKKTVSNITAVCQMSYLVGGNKMSAENVRDFLQKPLLEATEITNRCRLRVLHAVYDDFESFLIQ